jgi:hypothetical protein
LLTGVAEKLDLWPILDPSVWSLTQSNCASARFSQPPPHKGGYYVTLPEWPVRFAESALSHGRSLRRIAAIVNYRLPATSAALGPLSALPQAAAKERRGPQSVQCDAGLYRREHRLIHRECDREVQRSRGYTPVGRPALAALDAADA